MILNLLRLVRLLRSNRIFHKRNQVLCKIFSPCNYKIDIFDNTGESIRFILVDTLFYKNDNYTIITPYIDELDDDAYDIEDIFVYFLKIDPEDMATIIEDEVLLAKLFEIFKNKQV